MPFLTVAGVTVPVFVENEAEMKEEIVGDSGRAFAGNLRGTVRARKRIWGPIVTKPMPRADADTLYTTLKGAPPLACAGDLLGGAVSCWVMAIGRRSVTSGATEVIVTSFELHEV